MGAPMTELELDRQYQRGDQAGMVSVIQEWLSLHGWTLRIDGDFGPATEIAVKQFQAANGMESDGIVGVGTFERLVAPAREALTVLSPQGRNFGELAAAYAGQHLAHDPREVGGQNRGPWVRLYMKGNQGNDFPWCAGFAFFCLNQAAKSLGQPCPLKETFSCDEIAKAAKATGAFIAEPSPANRARVQPGSLFLLRKTPADWVHTGLVIHVGAEAFQTIEGNTNDEGSREGYEVCKRNRGYGRCDFVVFA